MTSESQFSIDQSLSEKTGIEVLGLSVRTYNCLRRTGIDTVEQVTAMSDEDLLVVRNLGIAAPAEIREKLEAYLASHPLPEQPRPAEPLPSEPPSIVRVPIPDDTPIEALDLSIRSHYALVRGGVITIRQLAQMSSWEILALRAIDGISLAEIQEALKAYLAEHPPSPDSPILKLLRAPHPDNTPIEELELSVRAYNCLKHGRIHTIGQLSQKSSDQLLSIRNFAQKLVAEVQEALKSYLKVRSFLPPEPDAPSEPKPLPLELPVFQKLETLFRMDPILLAWIARIPLDNIPLVRLGLPIDSYYQLLNQGIGSIGELVRRHAYALYEDSPIKEQLTRYLTWLLDQDRSTLADEAAGRGINPLQRLALAKTTLDDLLEQWLSVLSEQERQVLLWRFGFDGRILTLGEVGQRMGIDREDVRWLESRALRRLRHPKRRSSMQPLVEPLRQKIVEAGGLMTWAEEEETITMLVRVEAVNVRSVWRLIYAIHGTLVDVPYHLVDDVRKAMVKLLRAAKMPLPPDEVIARFKATAFYQEHYDELKDAFIAACLRTCWTIKLRDGRCVLAKWASKRTPWIAMALQDIGEPAHYKVITEQVNKLLPPHSQTTPRNVHAALGRCTDLFVRVGHGIFGLKEWGLPDDGSLANAAYRVLREVGRPLHIDVLTDEVLKTWRVRPSSVQVAVENDKRFSRIGRGVYWLREQISSETETSSQADFGDLYGARLTRWQAELDHCQDNAEYDTHDEVDKIREIGIDFL